MAAARARSEDVMVPVCVRFRGIDLAAAHGAAASVGLAPTVWVREVALERARRVVASSPRPALSLEDPAPLDDQVCVRMRPEDWLLVRRAAAREGFVPSRWVRATVLRRLGRG